jgi:hypothetical protein
VTSRADDVAETRSAARSRLARPAALAVVAAAVAAAAFQVWITPGNPPGFIRDEASIAYNAYTLSQGLCDQDGALLPLAVYWNRHPGALTAR